MFDPFIGFMVLKTTSLSSWFQLKNRFSKICIGSRDNSQDVSKFGLPNQTFPFWHKLTNILEVNAYFSKLTFALKPWTHAGSFEYHEPYKRNNFFFYKGGSYNFQQILAFPTGFSDQVPLVKSAYIWPNNHIIWGTSSFLDLGVTMTAPNLHWS